jgi:hypothetical protein
MESLLTCVMNPVDWTGMTVHPALTPVASSASGCAIVIHYMDIVQRARLFGKAPDVLSRRGLLQCVTEGAVGISALVTESTK